MDKWNIKRLFALFWFWQELSQDVRPVKQINLLLVFIVEIANYLS